ncbi:hypothetical protein O3P69_017236 [Scylla paramamosain]|uniref:Uncharacterized protein n=1 Tax=Scylla paramamosain TaxID=85552 RepID=A0AAW0TZE6_SCYPA
MRARYNGEGQRVTSGRHFPVAPTHCDEGRLFSRFLCHAALGTNRVNVSAWLTQTESRENEGDTLVARWKKCTAQPSGIKDAGSVANAFSELV